MAVLEAALEGAEAGVGAACAASAELGLQSKHDLLKSLKRRYAALKEAAKEAALDTRAVVGDVAKGWERVGVLHREAVDGAKR